MPLKEFKEFKCEKINSLTKHSFICKTQSQYVKSLKENMEEHQCFILGDFAENFEFVVQD